MCDSPSRDRRKAGRAKKGRLIVRNLSFKATEEELKRHFEGAKGGKTKGGGPTVTDVHILKRPDGRRVGCAFVQVRTRIKIDAHLLCVFLKLVPEM